MKANQAFRQNDDAVSPVIAVILMVAITVVLAATVYVWVSGFGTQSSNPAKTLSLTSGSALTTGSPTGNKTYTVASASSGMRWSDITITIDGASQTEYVTAGACPAIPGSAAPATFLACTGGATITAPSTTVVSAGDTVKVEANSGQTLRVLDTQANSVILTLVIG